MKLNALTNIPFPESAPCYFKVTTHEGVTGSNVPAPGAPTNTIIL